MPLFACENCHCQENTALSEQGFKRTQNYDWSYAPERKGMALCSACGPTHYSDGSPTPFGGKWHGKFARQAAKTATADGARTQAHAAQLRGAAQEAEPRVQHRCDMGVGCEETGVCYAQAQGEPDRCGRQPAHSTPQDGGNTPSDVQANAIKSLMSGLAAGISAQHKKAFEAVAQLPEAQNAIEAVKARSLQDFYFEVLYPHKCMVDGLLETTLPNRPVAHFLIKHHDFVERHFSELIRQIEGSACCADKSKTITTALLRHLADDAPISFDYNQTYTYHLPRKVFTTEAQILEFFNAVYRLFYGQHAPFLEAYGRLLSLRTTQL